jgi:hypothetical protein
MSWGKAPARKDELEGWGGTGRRAALVGPSGDDEAIMGEGAAIGGSRRVEVRGGDSGEQSASWAGGSREGGGGLGGAWLSISQRKKKNKKKKFISRSMCSREDEPERWMGVRGWKEANS